MKAFTRLFVVAVALHAVAVFAQRASPGAFAAGQIAIRGVVLDAQGQPVKRAVVQLLAQANSDRRALSTRPDGRFEFSGLPPGRYTISVSKPGHITTTFGSDGRGMPIAATAGQTVADVVLRLERGAVIAGRVLNQAGEPEPNALVRALRLRAGPTGPSLEASPESVRTDDRGDYRLFGLPGGDYAVVVSSARVGQVTMTREGSNRAPRTVTFVPTYYPATNDAAAAGIIHVSSGEERLNVDVQSSAVRTSRIEGLVSGFPPERRDNVIVDLVPKSMLRLGNEAIATTTAQPADGRFSFDGIAPGDYVVTATEGGALTLSGDGVIRLTARNRMPRTSPLYAAALVRVDGSDVAGVALSLERTGRIAGSLVVVARHHAALPPMRLELEPVATVFRALPTLVPIAPDAMGRVSADGVAPGAYTMLLRVPLVGQGASTPWWIRSVVVDDQDVTWSGFEVKAGQIRPTFIVTVTDEAGELAGTFSDTSGRPATDYGLVLFPSDRRAWNWQAHRVALAQPDTSGAYTFSNIPPGEYFLGAAAGVDSVEALEGGLLESLAVTAIRVTLHDGVKTVQDIAVSGQLR